MAELKPCPTPWCEHPTDGSPYIWQDCRDEFTVICDGCNVQGPFCGTEAEAIEAWNAALSGISEVVEALEQIETGLAFREQRFAEDSDADYFLRTQRNVQRAAAAALSRYREGES